MKEILASFQSALNERLSLFWENKLTTFGVVTSNTRLLDFVSQAQAVSHGGKRVRPFVAWLSSGKPMADMNETEWNYLLAIELIHVFALIHDDIMDQATTRHHAPTIHRHVTRQLTAEGRDGDVEFQGDMQAMLVGDLVFWLAGDLIRLSPKDPDPKQFQNIRDEFTNLVEKVVFGQMLDFDTMSRVSISDDEVLEKTLHKTAHYTFSYPLAIGNHLSEAQEKRELLLEIGTSIGLAYQIQDDLLDITGKIEDKPRFKDVAQGQHTILSQHVFTKGSQSEQELLHSLWRKPLSNEQQQTLVDLFRDTGALAHARQVADTYFDKAQELIATLSSASLQNNLHALVSYLRNREY